MRHLRIPDDVRHCLRLWYCEEFIDEVPVLQGTLIGWLFGCFGQDAVVINRKVHFTPRSGATWDPGTVALLAHEYYHVWQQQEMGWLPFLCRYLWHWRPSYIKEGRRHPMERAAYDRADLVRGYLE